MAISSTNADRSASEVTVTMANLPLAFYDYERHGSVRDRGRRRYHPFAFDFDTSSMVLEDAIDTWDEGAKAQRAENQKLAMDRLRAEYGEYRLAQVVLDTKELGAKSFSIVSYHNQMHEQARRAFIAGHYFPALTAACAIGERILNHLILDLRDFYKSSKAYKFVFRKESFPDWARAVDALEEWDVLLPGVGAIFIELSALRNRSLHFNPATYSTMRDDALVALKSLGRAIEMQFGVFGGQPWFIENTPGAQFIKRDHEHLPFVRKYLIPLSGFVGVNYGMEFNQRGWQHLDYDDYGPGELDDDEFAHLFRSRAGDRVVTRAMIDASVDQQQNNKAETA